MCAGDGPGPLLCARQGARVTWSKSHAVACSVCGRLVTPCISRRAGGRGPRLPFNLLSTLGQAELGLQAQVPRMEACGAVVISALAVVLGELIRRCCVEGSELWWIGVPQKGDAWLAGASGSLKQYISSSSLFKHWCSDFPRSTRSSSVKLRSSVGALCSSVDVSDEAAMRAQRRG